MSNTLARMTLALRDPSNVFVATWVSNAAMYALQTKLRIWTEMSDEYIDLILVWRVSSYVSSHTRWTASNMHPHLQGLSHTRDKQQHVQSHATHGAQQVGIHNIVEKMFQNLRGNL